MNLYHSFIMCIVFFIIIYIMIMIEFNKKHISTKLIMALIPSFMALYVLLTPDTNGLSMDIKKILIIGGAVVSPNMYSVLKLLDNKNKISLEYKGLKIDKSESEKVAEWKQEK